MGTKITLTEEDLDSLLNSIPDFIFLFDEYGTFLDYRNNLKEMTLYREPQSFIGKNANEVLPPDIANSTLTAIRQALKEKRTIVFPYRLNMPDGPQDYIARLVPLKNSRVLAIIRDNTEKQQTLVKYHALFRQMLEGFALHQIICDKHGRPVDYRFLEANPAFEQITGLKSENIIGKTVREVLPDIEPQWIETYGQVALYGKPVFFDNYSVSLKKHFSVTAYQPIPGHFACIFVDITSIKAQEEKLNTIQRLEALGVLAGGIAHDFNNLLGGLFGYLDLAASKTSEKPVADNLNKALGALERARGLTRQLLTFAKGGIPIKQPGDLGATLQEAVDFALSGSNVTCKFDLQSSLFSVDFDKTQITQVIDNLVINACQAMPGGGQITITGKNITLESSADKILPAGRYVKISVHDSGVGMPREILPRIFDPFYTTKAKGQGLGLATCFSIITKHGGTIEAESEPGKGSDFHFYLPANNTTHIPIVRSKQNHCGNGLFLLMDDELIIHDTAGEMLELFGYKAVCFKDGRSLINHYLSERKANRLIAGMLLDLTIPGGMGGIETARNIRESDKTIPIYVSSGYSDDPAIAAPASFGFTASIVKPYRTSELAAMLEKYQPKKQ